MMRFDPNNNPYRVTRKPVYSKNGMVATSQNLAASAGESILRSGGNAVDAAIAIAACLTVTEPTSNGIGSDAFAIVRFENELYGINASGYAPRKINIDSVMNAGFDKMPRYGMIPVTVPGTPYAWAELSSRFGALSLSDCLKPAIEYALEGFPVSPVVSENWERAFRNYKAQAKSDVFIPWFQTFAPNDKTPKPGEIFRLPHHAETLRDIGLTGAKSFYNGDLANEISKFFTDYDGFLDKDDLSGFTPEWVEPISINYRGYDIHEIPPNGQGIVALIALRLMQAYEFESRDASGTFHKQFEAIKLAFSAGKQYVTDPRYMEITPEQLLSDDFIGKMRMRIGEFASDPDLPAPNSGGTVYLATADKHGNMVSYIQSNYNGFGSGIVIPGTGIAMQNRGADFSLDPNHINKLESGKKTYHTIIPGFITKNNEAIGPFGVMNSIDFMLNPQAAIDAPRWQWISGKTFEVERGFDEKAISELSVMGHKIHVKDEVSGFGRGQIIWRNPIDGVLTGGSDARADSAIASY